MHRIRLRPPWQARWCPVEPSDDRLIAVEYERKFHRPTGLADHQRVQIELTAADPPPDLETEAMDWSAWSAACNSQPLELLVQSPNCATAEVSSALDAFNNLHLVVRLPSRPEPADAQEPPALARLLSVELQILD